MVNRVNVRTNTPPFISDECLYSFIKSRNTFEACTEEKKCEQRGLETDIRQKMLKTLEENFWSKKAGFYLSKVNFTHDVNYCDQFRAPKAVICERPERGSKHQLLNEK